MCSNSLNSQKNKEWAHDSHKLSRTPFLNDDTLHQILSKIHLRYICIYFGVRDVQAHLGKEPSKAQLERVETPGRPGAMGMGKGWDGCRAADMQSSMLSDGGCDVTGPSGDQLACLQSPDNVIAVLITLASSLSGPLPSSAYLAIYLGDVSTC